jgi:hypothetical protein
MRIVSVRIFDCVCELVPFEGELAVKIPAVGAAPNMQAYADEPEDDAARLERALVQTSLVTAAGHRN